MKQSELGKVVANNLLPAIATAADPLHATRIPVGTYRLHREFRMAPAVRDGKPWVACVLENAQGECFYISPRVIQALARVNGTTKQVHQDVPCFGKLVDFAASEPTIEITKYEDYEVDVFGEEGKVRTVAMPHFAKVAVTNNGDGKKGKK